MRELECQKYLSTVPVDETGEELLKESEREYKKRLSRIAYELLNECIIVPGAKSDGSLDGEILRRRISNARKLYGQINRIEAADYEIGKFLEYSLVGWMVVGPFKLLISLITRIIGKASNDLC